MDEEQAFSKTVNDAARRGNAPWGEAAVLLSFVALCWLAYGGNAGHELLNWDDITYVSGNPWITYPTWAHVRELFTQFREQNWHPLTWLSYIPEYRVCGPQAYCYKATNLVLHACNSYLVYRLSLRIVPLTLANAGARSEHIRLASLFAGALFAVHTQHTESVTWVAERKDLLCALFFISAMICYLRQHQEPAHEKSHLPFLFFALALMSKSMAVTLPAVLLILDFHPLDRFRNANLRSAIRIAIVEKLHFHVVTLILVGITLVSQNIDAVAQPPFLQRVMFATASVWHYLASFVWPWNFSPFYPKEIVAAGPGLQASLQISATLLVALACAAFGGKRGIAFVAYFLVTLAPVLGLVKVGEQAYADRYTYLPMIGFYVLAGLAIAWIAGSGRRRRIAAAGLAGAILIALTVLTHEYKGTWRSNLALWQRAVAAHPDVSAMLHSNLGNSYFELRRFREAIGEYRRGLAVDPRRHELYGNLGLAQERVGENEAALKSYLDGVENDPTNPWMYLQVADGLFRMGDRAGALKYYTGALRIDPSNANALLGAGKIFLIAGDTAHAIPLLEAVSPDSIPDLDAQLLLAQAYMVGDPRRATQILDRIDSRYGPTREVEALRAKIDNQLDAP